MKPFINYIGSKNFLLKQVKLPKNINNYYEPFVGGGSMLFYINQKYNIKKNYINDLDSDLIMVYKVIKKDLNKLLEKLKELNTKKSKNNFNNYIKIFNTNKLNKILLSAIYIYITKISFNSLLSYNKKNNKINPYYSKYNTKKNIYKEQNLINISKLLKKTIIKNKDYILFLKQNKPQKGDFVFLDPPYLVKKINEYYKNIFTLKDFENLKKKCDELNKNKVNFMVTLNKNKELIDLFKKYKITYINKKSTVSNKIRVEKEMIITNY